jgi:hypothetical protein
LGPSTGVASLWDAFSWMEFFDSATIFTLDVATPFCASVYRHAGRCFGSYVCFEAISQIGRRMLRQPSFPQLGATSSRSSAAPQRCQVHVHNQFGNHSRLLLIYDFTCRPP